MSGVLDPGDSKPGINTTTAARAKQAIKDNAKLDAQMPNSLLSHITFDGRKPQIAQIRWQ